MKTCHILYIIIIGLLLLYLLNKQRISGEINTKLYNPFIITKNQERQISSDYNNQKLKNIDDKKWISDDLLIKRCYNLCQSNYLDDYNNCINNCQYFQYF